MLIVIIIEAGKVITPVGEGVKVEAIEIPSTP